MKYLSLLTLLIFLASCVCAQECESRHLFSVTVDGKYGFIDNKGELVVPAIYDELGSFSEGLIPFKKDRKWGYMDKNGKVVIQPQYDRAAGFSNGLARIEVNFQVGFIRKDGKYAISPRYSTYELRSDFHDGLALIEKDYSKRGFIDATGRLRIEPRFDWAHEFSEGLAAVRLDGKWGFIDTQGRIKIPTIYDEASSFYEGLAPVEKAGKHFFIDTDGNVKVEPEADYSDEFFGGIFVNGRVRWKLNNEAWGLIDRNGNWVISPMFEGLWNFSDGLARFEKGGKYGYIDYEGTVQVPADFDFTHEFCGGLAYAVKGDDRGYINKKGEFVWKNKYK